MPKINRMLIKRWYYRVFNNDRFHDLGPPKCGLLKIDACFGRGSLLKHVYILLQYLMTIGPPAKQEFLELFVGTLQLGQPYVQLKLPNSFRGKKTGEGGEGGHEFLPDQLLTKLWGAQLSRAHKLYRNKK